MQPASMSKSLIVSVTSIVLATLVCIWQVPGLMGAAFPPNTSKGDVSSTLATHLGKHGPLLLSYQDRFDGRSAFFRPKPPPVKQQTVLKPKKRDDPAPPPPPPPSIYTGPKPAFVIGEVVYFKGGTHLRVGEEERGVTVVATDPPWTITLEQHGKDFVIDIFKRSSKGLGSSVRRGSILPPGLTIVDPAEVAHRDDGDAGESTGN